MTDWNTEQYLSFEKQRTQPAVDLAGRIARYKPHSVIDIGCGPGNSTAVLRNVFPQAVILGVDSSKNMIEAATQAHPDITFARCDVTVELSQLGRFDVIFSNACLQWIPSHTTFLPKLLAQLNAGGVLAVQLPMNAQEPLFAIIESVVRRPEWGFAPIAQETNETLSPEAYFELLASHAADFDIWETVYYHPMPTVQSMIDWVRGTRLRPYLSQLDVAAAVELENEILTRAATVYHRQNNGAFILKFRRLFFTATK